ncbi:Rieske (2Fe-2S) protein [Candidatus Zixiibacteriota bacterium]
MNKIKMCHIDELPVGGSVVKRILARRIAVFNDNGTLYGMEGDCKHMKATLAGSEIKNGIVTCRWHHWKYKLETGECLNVDKVKLKKYEIELNDDYIYVLLN